METAKMSGRGQIIIPKGIRESVSAMDDTIFAMSTIDENTIVMRKIDTSSVVEEFNKLRNKNKKFSSAKIEQEIHAAKK